MYLKASKQSGRKFRCYKSRKIQTSVCWVLGGLCGKCVSLGYGWGGGMQCPFRNFVTSFIEALRYMDRKVVEIMPASYLE